MKEIKIGRPLCRLWWPLHRWSEWGEPRAWGRARHCRRCGAIHQQWRSLELEPGEERP